MNGRAEVIVGAALALGVAACGAPSTPSDPGTSANRLEIRLTPNYATYPAGDSAFAVAVTVAPDGSTTITGVTWRSRQPAVAGVDGSGKITARSNGDATIEAVAGSRTATIVFRVLGVLHRGAIAESEEWRATDSPHIVTGQVAVGGSNSPTLTIEPGATLRFRPRALMAFGDIAPGRLVIPAGGAPVVIEGDSVGRGSWDGLLFYSDLRSELRNVTFRHCGRGPAGGATPVACVGVQSRSGRDVSILLDGVTVTEPHGPGISIDNFVAFAPGSKNLTVTGGDGPVAMLSPEAAATLPRGGNFDGNAQNEFVIGSGYLRTSGSWDSPGPAWRISGEILMSGPASPVLTIPPGSIVRADPPGRFRVGDNGPGGLRIGGPGGSPVTITPTGSTWGGIEIQGGGGPNELVRTTIRGCGSAIQGATQACIRVLGGTGNGTALLVDSLTVRDTPWNAILVGGDARFAAGSKNLTVTGAGGVPVAASASAAGTIPSGNLTGNAEDVVEIMPQDVDESVTWNDLGVPFRAASGLEIGRTNGAVILTLGPGVRVQVGPDRAIFVFSAMRALGTAAKPVILSATSPGTAGFWVGVRLTAAGDTRSKFDHVEIVDAGLGEAGVAGAFTLETDPGGLITNTIVRRSPTCGILLFGGPWVTDYTDPVFGNSFIGVAGPPRCLFP